MGNGNYCKLNSYTENGEMKMLKPAVKRYSESGMNVNNLTFSIKPQEKVNLL
jgi:hypothetical protein